MYMVEHAIDSTHSAIFWKENGMPPMVLPESTGSVTMRSLPESFAAAFPGIHSFPVVNKAVRDAFVRRHFPTTWDYEMEQADASLASSGL